MDPGCRSAPIARWSDIHRSNASCRACSALGGWKRGKDCMVNILTASGAGWRTNQTVTHDRRFVRNRLTKRCRSPLVYLSARGIGVKKKAQAQRAEGPAQPTAARSTCPVGASRAESRAQTASRRSANIQATGERATLTGASWRGHQRCDRTCTACSGGTDCLRANRRHDTRETRGFVSDPSSVGTDKHTSHRPFQGRWLGAVPWVFGGHL